MATCRYCKTTGWTLQINAAGICPGCEAATRAAVDAHLARIQDALLLLRRGRQPEELLRRCEEALGWTRELVRHERLGLVPIQPSPSALLPVLETRRSELLAELRRAETGRGPSTRRRSAARRSAKPKRPGRTAAGGPWWPWGARDEAEAPPAPEQRRSARERIHCLVLLEPGGLRATVENLSAHGLLLRAPRVRSPGSVVRLVLDTPGGPLRAEGVVRWIADEDTDGRTGAGMGIEFTRRSPALDDYLRASFPSLFGARPGGSGASPPGAA